MISTQYLGKEYVRKTLDNKDEKDSTKDTIELASKIKIVALVFQNLLKHMSLIAIVSARPQGNNETSAFAKDMCEAASLIEKDLDKVRFTNFATNGLSVETCNVLQTLCQFMNRKTNYCAAVDNKHNIKNDRCQLIGRSNVATIGNYYVDTNLLLMAQVSSNLLAPKDFASDKKVEQIFSYPTINKVDTDAQDRNIIGLEGDCAILCVTWFFIRLCLFAVSIVNVPSKHRAICLGLSMF